ncbi:MAG: hypothetical protein PHN90_08010, partial [Methanothrix sp.]|nr:hypothetical protein [Methanothrix sp.]
GIIDSNDSNLSTDVWAKRFFQVWREKDGNGSDLGDEATIIGDEAVEAADGLHPKSKNARSDHACSLLMRRSNRAAANDSNAARSLGVPSLSQ